jgi:hypothetical protein
MTDIAKSLRAAARRLRRVGWCRNGYGGAAGPNDLAGVFEQAPDFGPNQQARWFLQEELLGGRLLEHFNDTEVNNKAEAIAFLELGAEIAEAEGL